MLRFQIEASGHAYYYFPYDFQLCRGVISRGGRQQREPDGGGYVPTGYAVQVPVESQTPGERQYRLHQIFRPYRASRPGERRQWEDFYFITRSRYRCAVTTWLFEKLQAEADKEARLKEAVERMNKDIPRQFRPRKVRSDKLPDAVRRAQAAERQRQFRLRRQVKQLAILYPRAPLPMVELLRNVPELLEIYGKKKNNKK